MAPFHTPRTASKNIRPWPYPYRAGLAISNDAEFMGFDFFKTLMDFLNGTSDTALGKGLGLPVTSSVFFYSAPSYNFSYFDGKDAGAKETIHAEKIVDCIRNGYIDTIHAYGDFDGEGGFTRAHAERYFETLNRHNLSLPIFTNHGGAENIQNIGTDAAYHRGDDPKSPAYHTDLMVRNGVRYIWTDSMTTHLENEPKHWRAVAGDTKHALKMFLKGQKKPRPRHLVHDTVLQDGQTLRGFMRFRSTGQNAPNFSSLKHQLDQINWSDFYANQHGVVLYQHLGVLHRINGKCSAASIDDLRLRPDLFLSPFYRLKEEKERGALWVARLIDFLDYVSMVESVSVTETTPGTYSLDTLKTLNIPVNLTGLTLYVDTSRPVKILYQGKDMNYAINGPDHTGRYSITILDRQG